MKPKVASLASDASAGKFPFHYGGEADQYTFYRIPKLLFDDAVLRQLSTDAKVLPFIRHVYDKMQGLEGERNPTGSKITKKEFVNVFLTS